MCPRSENVGSQTQVHTQAGVTSLTSFRSYDIGPSGSRHRVPFKSPVNFWVRINSNSCYCHHLECDIELQPCQPTGIPRAATTKASPVPNPCLLCSVSDFLGPRSEVILALWIPFVFSAPQTVCLDSSQLCPPEVGWQKLARRRNISPSTSNNLPQWTSPQALFIKT